MNVFRPWGKITYDSLQLSVTRRMIAGFQFTSAYTYARAIDWWAGNITIPEYYHLNKATQGGGAFQAARAGTSTPHKVDASVIYQLPFGPGRPHLNSGGALAAIAGGWQVSSTFTAYDGAPFTVTSSYGFAERSGESATGRSGEGQRRNFRRRGSDDAVLRRHRVQGGHRATVWYRHVQQPARPGVRNFDLSLTRTLALGGAKTLQLKVDVYNLFNRPTFANPSEPERVEPAA